MFPSKKLLSSTLLGAMLALSTDASAADAPRSSAQPQAAAPARATAAPARTAPAPQRQTGAPASAQRPLPQGGSRGISQGSQRRSNNGQGGRRLEHRYQRFARADGTFYYAWTDVWVDVPAYGYGTAPGYGYAPDTGYGYGVPAPAVVVCPSAPVVYISPYLGLGGVGYVGPRYWGGFGGYHGAIRGGRGYHHGR